MYLLSEFSAEGSRPARLPPPSEEPDFDGGNDDFDPVTPPDSASLSMNATKNGDTSARRTPAGSEDVEGAQGREGADRPDVHMLDVEFGGDDDVNFDEKGDKPNKDLGTRGLCAVNDLEELHSDGAAAAKEAPHLARLVNLRKILSKIK